MPRTRFAVRPVDESFFSEAPVQLRETFRIPLPAADVWAQLTRDDALHWCRLVSAVRWTSPPPFGVGTTRTVSALAGQNVLDERYFIWEEGRRKAFHGVRASMPLFKRFAEDYAIQPTSDASCHFTWTVAVEPKLPARLAAPIDKRVFATLFRDTRRHFAAT